LLRFVLRLVGCCCCGGCCYGGRAINSGHHHIILASITPANARGAVQCEFNIVVVFIGVII